MKKKIFGLTGLSILTIFLLAFVANSFAQERERDNRRHGKEKKEVVVRHDDYRDIAVKNRHYFYREGYFYDKRANGYVKIEAPFGARISVLPHGFRTIKIHRAKYYMYGGIYYRFLPHEKVYEVVELPR